VEALRTDARVHVMPGSAIPAEPVASILRF